MTEATSTKSVNSSANRLLMIDFDQGHWTDTSSHCQTNPSTKKSEKSELAKTIISSYQARNDNTRASWMHQLAECSVHFLAEQRSIMLKKAQEEMLYTQSVSSLINQIFQLLEAFALDFNYLLGRNELNVTCTKPALVTEILRYNKFREPLQTIAHIRARISTRVIGLVIRGSKDSIDFLYMPTEKVIGLSQAESAYESVCCFQCQLVDGNIIWYCGQSELTQEQLNAFCMDLFSGLIERTKSEP